MLVRDTSLRVLRSLLLCTVGLVPAVFLVFATLFSDSGGVRDLAIAYGLTFLAYLLLAFVVGLLWPRERLSSAASLLSSAVVIALLYATQEPQIIPVGIVELAAAFVGTLVGVVMGASLRLRGRGG
jgi:hypothetical protein